MSGFVFDAKAARAAIAARGPGGAAAAVSAVLAVEGTAKARKPQEPHGKPFRTAIAQPQKPQQPQGASIPAGAVSADEIEERVALAAGGVPKPYLDAWARLQCQKPVPVPEAQWRQAIADAGKFLDKWGKRAADNGWTARDLFDLPDRGVPGGLLWFTRGRPVASIGPGFASVGTGHVVFNRTTRQSWQNPYVLPCETLQ